MILGLVELRYLTCYEFLEQSFTHFGELLTIFEFIFITGVTIGYYAGDDSVQI